MIKEIKSRINKPVFLISAVAGGILWFFCNYLYSTYRLKIAGFLMIRRPPRSTLSSSSAASDVYKETDIR